MSMEIFVHRHEVGGTQHAFPGVELESHVVQLVRLRVTRTKAISWALIEQDSQMARIGLAVFHHHVLDQEEPSTFSKISGPVDVRAIQQAVVHAARAMPFSASLGPGSGLTYGWPLPTSVFSAASR